MPLTQPSRTGRITLLIAIAAAASTPPASAQVLPPATRPAAPLEGPGSIHMLHLGDDVYIELIELPMGEFLMGSPTGTGGDDERPRRRVRIEHIVRMGRYEVTVAQFRQFVAETGYQTEAEKNGTARTYHPVRGWEETRGIHWRNPGFPQTDDHPVVCVSWNDAQAFCLWVTRHTDTAVTLPSEAEWEYAASAAQARIYPWGNHWPPTARDANLADLSARRHFGDPFGIVDDSFDDGYPFTAPVGRFEPNPFGLYDLAGNVWEWCEDAYFNSYAGAPLDGRAVGAEARSRVLRGGSWNYSIRRLLRTAYRDFDAPTYRDPYTGFRIVARSAPPKQP